MCLKMILRIYQFIFTPFIMCPPSLGAVYIITMKIQVLEMLVYCCMLVAIQYIQKNSSDEGTVKNKRLLSVRTARKLCQVCCN